MFNLFKYFYFIGLVFLFSAVSAYAAVLDTAREYLGPTDEADAPLKISPIGPHNPACLYLVALNLINWFFGFAILLGIAMMIYAGVEYMMASRAGDKDKTAKSKDRVVWVVVGTVIVYLAYLIITKVVPTTIGVLPVFPTVSGVPAALECFGIGIPNIL